MMLPPFLTGLAAGALARQALPLMAGVWMLYAFVAGSARADHDRNGLRDDVQRMVERQTDPQVRAATLAFAQTVQGLSREVALVPCNPNHPVHRQLRLAAQDARTLAAHALSAVDDLEVMNTLDAIQRAAQFQATSPWAIALGADVKAMTCGRL